MFTIRPIQERDNVQIARVIRDVSKEFGLGADKGYGCSDPLDDLYRIYQQPNSRYWVIVDDERDCVVGGGGISPLKGDQTILEIQKMYFEPVVRGNGKAKLLMQLCFEFALQQGFNDCYLETTASLYQAVKLYEKLGFQHLNQPKGSTGHSNSCEIWMLKSL